jgi:hypothetical protein
LSYGGRVVGEQFGFVWKIHGGASLGHATRLFDVWLCLVIT